MHPGAIPGGNVTVQREPEDAYPGFPDVDLAAIEAEEAAMADVWASDDASERAYVRDNLARLSKDDADAGDLPPGQVITGVLDVLATRTKKGALVARVTCMDGVDRLVAYGSSFKPSTRDEPGDAEEYLVWEGISGA